MSSSGGSNSGTLFQNLRSFFPAASEIGLRDVQIREGSESGEASLGFHRLLLSLLCPMLKSVLLEQSGWDEPSVVLIPGVRIRDLERFLSQILDDAASADPALLAEMGRLFHIPELSGPSSSSSSLTCPVCDKSFSQARYLRRHVNSVHDPGNPWSCRECGRGCRSRSELRIHTRSHTKEKPHECGQCGKGFAQVTN